VIKILLYDDDLVLIAKSTQGLQMHLYALDLFCNAMMMQVNTNKTKIMIFSNKKKQSQHAFFFEGNILQEVRNTSTSGLISKTSLIGSIAERSKF